MSAFDTAFAASTFPALISAFGQAVTYTDGVSSQSITGLPSEVERSDELIAGVGIDRATRAWVFEKAALNVVAEPTAGNYIIDPAGVRYVVGPVGNLPAWEYDDASGLLIRVRATRIGNE